MVKQSLNIAASQHSGFPKNLTHTIITIPAQSAFSFGSMSIIDLKQKGIKIHDLTLQFNTNAITGTQAANGTFPYLSPVYHWFQKLELIVNGNVVDTLYPDIQFILNNLYFADEDRLLNNYASGYYANPATNRYALSNTNNSNWFLSLKSFVNQNHYAILTQNHEIQLRVTMNPLSNIINVGALTGTPSCTINSVSLLARVTQLDQSMQQKLLVDMNKVPRHSLFHATRYQSFVVQSGVTTSTLVLTAITGSVHSLYFIVRPTTSLTGSNAYSYTPIKDFYLNNADGSNAVGGTTIPSSFNLLIQNKHWFLSTFTAEATSGANNSNVYTYSFSVDPASSFQNASHLTTKQFTGNEQLIINYTAALSGTYQVDVYALVEASLEQTPAYTKMITI